MKVINKHKDQSPKQINYNKSIIKYLEVATENDYMLLQASMDGVTVVTNAIKRIGTELMNKVGLSSGSQQLIQRGVELCRDLVKLQ